MRTSFLAAVKAGPFRHLVAKNLHLSGDRIAVCFSRIVRYLNFYFEDEKPPPLTIFFRYKPLTIWYLQ